MKISLPANFLEVTSYCVDSSDLYVTRMLDVHDVI